MTTTIKSETIDNYDVRMQVQNKCGFEYYSVSMYYYGRECAGNVYELNERRNALACFRRYVKKVKLLEGWLR